VYLTKRQREILDFIQRFIAENQYSPSIQEIGKHFGLTSTATIHKHLQNLKDKKMIRRIPNRSRSLELPAPRHKSTSQEVPLLGTIAAGQPIETFSVEESIQIPSDMLGRRKTYVLRVRGDSMIDDHIKDGDYVIVDETHEAKDGETVVALVGTDQVTLKRFYRDGGKIRLQPANPNVKPILVSPDEVRIQGVVIGILRKF
jgi:repressor LexA